jgi:hypothetical protein
MVRPFYRAMKGVTLFASVCLFEALNAPELCDQSSNRAT